MKFQTSLFRACLIFYTYDSANFKSIGNNTMKKMLLATALASILQDVLNRRLLFKTNCSSRTKGNHHPSFLRFLELGRRKLSMQPKICGGAENVVKTETQQTFVNGLLGFITLGHLYSAGSACVLLTIIA